MNLDRATIHPEIAIKVEAEAARCRALSRASPEAVQHLDEQDILDLQRVLRSGEQYGIWSTPKKYSPIAARATMNIDLRQRIAHFLPEHHKNMVRLADEMKSQIKNGAEAKQMPPQTSAPIVRQILDGAVLGLMRYLILLRMVPAGIGRKGLGKVLDPTNVKAIGYTYMPVMFAIGVSKRLEINSFERDAGSNLENGDSRAPGYLSLIQSEDFEERVSASAKPYVLNECERMLMFADMGYWSDLPMIDEALKRVTHVAGSESPRRRQKISDPHLPLPDDYVAEMGRRSLWFIKDLAPGLMAVGEEMLAIWQRVGDPSMRPLTVRNQRRAQLKKFLSSYEWRDSHGQAIVAPPFNLRLAYSFSSNLSSTQFREHTQAPINGAENGISAADDSQTLMWPPRNYGHILGLQNNLQMSQLFVVALSTAARKSETLDLKRDCVQYERNSLPYAKGRTFKLVQSYDGELRDWVLPDLAVRAIEQQVRLVKLMEAINRAEMGRSANDGNEPPADPSTHLWAQPCTGAGNPIEPLVHLNPALITYAESIDMDTVPGGQRLRSHRFRKTIARLVALALTQAAKILMDLLGHESMGDTLRYILSDKELQPEIERVCREMRVMRAKQTIEAMVAQEGAQFDVLPLAGYGGPAALMMDRCINAYKDRLHRQGEYWGANSALELAEILTLQGKAWNLVRPGVICTKLPGTEAGPCNKSLGHPEPSRCKSSCDHRLEEAFLREDVDGSIRDAVTAYIETRESGDELTHAFWAGQVRTHLGRFDDLRAKWMSDPTVQSLMNEHSNDEVLV